MKHRTSILKIRLNHEERLALVTAGERVGVGPSTFARMAAVSAAGRKPAKPPRRKPDAYRQALAGWTAQLGWIGNNLNQCARVLNGGGSVESSALASIQAELQRLREIVLAYDQGPE
ncbi:plasmid mobilization relaxosome protein MobC [Bradyrhizobium pachyrhizi]|uniref:plasmid mobilization relaxosome protein MobC n=1 Tax=Bradyrhizobium pachyrhizi TaxID=280333 RepID=UPI003D36270B